MTHIQERHFLSKHVGDSLKLSHTDSRQEIHKKIFHQEEKIKTQNISGQKVKAKSFDIFKIRYETLLIAILGLNLLFSQI